MTSFFITPFEPREWKDAISDLRIDPSDFAEALRGRWPDAKINILEHSENSLLQWLLPPEEDQSALLGDLQANQQVVSFDAGPEESLVQFVLWYRTFISTKNRLFLSNDSQPKSLEIRTDATAQSLMEFVTS